MKRGFTLIEVLLAAVLLGVGLTVLLVGASRCLAVMQVARYYQEAEWVLGIGDLEHPILPTQEIDDMQVEAERYPNGFTYEREVEQDDEDEDGLHVVRTRVSWAYDDREAFEEVVSYVLVPEEAEEVKR